MSSRFFDLIEYIRIYSDLYNSYQLSIKKIFIHFVSNILMTFLIFYYRLRKVSTTLTIANINSDLKLYIIILIK